jgi:signal transduction histidine kinase
LRGIRTRLAVVLVALVAITVLAIGVGTYVFVDARLRDGLLADATRQAQFNLSVLVPERAPTGVTRSSVDVEGPALADAFRLRGDVETIVDFEDGQDPWVSRSPLLPAISTFPDSLQSLAAGGHLGYAWQPVLGAPSLVVGGRASAGPVFYFVFPAESIDHALEQLRAGLIVAALIAFGLALGTAGLVARGILRPVHSGSLAASRIAAGDLSARVPAGGADEFARWAAEFNRMADSLSSTIDRLVRSEAQNRRFVAEVSHELRTPLTALVAEASLIEPSLEGLSPEARRAGELLIVDVRRLRALVDDLMEVSRFDAHAEELQLEPVDLGRVVGSIVASRLPDAIVSAPAEAVMIESDVRRIDRIVGNLLDNARTHAPGAAVEVTVSYEGIASERGVAAGAATARVVVADRGPGVAPEAMPRLFERFYKADPSRRGGSSGLGLAIAAEHAALLGASLIAEARPGGGLMVTLTLPVTRSLPAGDALDIEAGQAPG